MNAAQDQIAARGRAIDASGWGRRFRLLQPHNLCFWVWAAGCAWGAWQTFELLDGTLPMIPRAYAAGLIVFGGYGVAYWVFLRSIDRYERLPMPLLLAGFAYGGLAAAQGYAAGANDALISVWGKLLGYPFADDWGAGITAPFTEELLKGAGFLLLLGLAPQIIRSPRAALFAGAAVGLGFQVFEDVLYGALGSMQSFNGDQVASVLGVALVRFASGVFSHAAYTALFSVGLLYAIGTTVVRRDVRRGLGFIGVAMLLHGLWDFAGAIGAGSSLTVVVLLGTMGVSGLALWLAFRASTTYEQGWMREVLAPEVATGTVTEAEADAVAGRRRDRRRFRGHRRHRRRAHLLDGVFDLAHELAVARGADTPDVEHARAEVTRLRERAVGARSPAGRGAGDGSQTTDR